VTTKLVPAQKLKILDFDIENRPLSYLGMDFTTSEVTAIAASWVGKREVFSWFLGVDDPAQILTEFVELFDEADIVTGHYIRRHDLPIINGALIEMGMPTLSKKLVSDTKTDLVTRKGISASQESLADVLGVRSPKYHMTQFKWRAANRLTPEGIAEARRRVIGDIRQHKQLRKLLIERGYLAAPSLWKP
jgi:hypothetical protein